MKAKKSLSQHFLIDTDVVERFINACDCQNHVVEIGPGRGALTKHLTQRSDYLTAIELDPLLANTLKKQFPQIATYHDNALTFDFTTLEGPIEIISNLPYNVASDIIRRLIRMHPHIQSLTLIIQKEMADTICAQPHNKIYGPLTLECQLFSNAEYLFSIPATSFDPAPNVESAAIRLTTKQPEYNIDLEAFIQFIHAAFIHRRKMIRKFLANVNLQELGIDGTARAEDLTLDQFAKAWLSKQNHQH